VEAVAKLLGGLHYDYRFRGDELRPVSPVDSDVQASAVNKLLGLIEPAVLALPQNLRYLVPPPPTEYHRDRENFPAATGAPFDHLAPARAGADLVLAELLQPQRLTRLAEQHALDPSQPDPQDLLARLVDRSWLARNTSDQYLNAIQTEVGWLLLRHLMALASDSSTVDSTRALGLGQLLELENELRGKSRKGDAQAIAAQQQIRQFLDRQSAEPGAPANPAPPGSPIG
jgi:hypothetical protein